ncbi:MAG: VanZ family protein [bacterium]
MRCRLREFIKYWLPPILYAFIIFYLSSQSSISVGPDIPHIDKLYHAGIYFVFALLLWRAFHYYSPPFLQKRAIWCALICTIIFGMSDEWHQLFVSFRHADIFDLLFDSVGASLAIIGVTWWNSGQKNEEKGVDRKEYQV